MAALDFFGMSRRLLALVRQRRAHSQHHLTPRRLGINWSRCAARSAFYEAAAKRGGAWPLIMIMVEER